MKPLPTAVSLRLFTSIEDAKELAPKFNYDGLKYDPSSENDNFFKTKLLFYFYNLLFEEVKNCFQVYGQKSFQQSLKKQQTNQ